MLVRNTAYDLFESTEELCVASQGVVHIGFDLAGSPNLNMFDKPLFVK